MATPTFCIIGAQKAGSTFLQTVLGDHPDVYMVERELAFFEDPDFGTLSWDTFLANFAQAGGRSAIGFKRPDYLALPQCAERLRRYLPDLRLLAVLRNPVDRAVSAYFHYARLGLLPVMDVSKAIRTTLDGSLATRYPIAETLITYGLYNQALRRYYALFPRNQILVLTMDEVTRDAGHAAHSIEDFLGIAHSCVATGRKRARNEGVYERRRLLFQRVAIRLRYTTTASGMRLRKTHAAPLTAPVYAGMQLTDRWLLRPLFGNTPPCLDKQLTEELRKKFVEDIRELEPLIERDLTQWYAASS